jgi:hypothetical protein
MELVAPDTGLQGCIYLGVIKPNGIDIKCGHYDFCFRFLYFETTSHKNGTSTISIDATSIHLKNKIKTR